MANERRKNKGFRQLAASLSVRRSAIETVAATRVLENTADLGTHEAVTSSALGFDGKVDRLPYPHVQGAELMGRYVGKLKLNGAAVFPRVGRYDTANDLRFRLLASVGGRGGE
jgi:hypothetical protein